MSITKSCLIFLSVFLALQVSLTSAGHCPAGFTQVAGASDEKCYKLICNETDMRWINETIVPFQDAYVECVLNQGWLARPDTLAQSNALKTWLAANYGEKFEEAYPAGVWLGYRRNDFPVGNLSYDDVVKPARIDPYAFYDMYLDCPRVVMNPNLWRNMTNPRGDQPNDKARNEDPVLINERCTAMKQITNPSNVGVDDYDCEDGTLHAVLCEACYIPHAY